MLQLKCSLRHEQFEHLVLLKQITQKAFNLIMSNLFKMSNSAMRLEKMPRKSTKNESVTKVSQTLEDKWFYPCKYTVPTLNLMYHVNVYLAFDVSLSRI